MLITASNIGDQTYTQIDSLTTTLSPNIGNICGNQTISPFEEIQDRINVVVPYLVILGIIGNGLSVLTFAQRKLRSLSCGCYLLLLAISDTISLLIISRPYFFRKYNIIDHLNDHHLNSNLICALHNFLTKVFDELTPWLLVFVACNRLVLSRYPRNYRFFQTSRAALSSTSFLLIFLVVLNIHLLFGLRVGRFGCQNVCGPPSSSEIYLFFYKHVSPIIDLLFSLIIPFCIVFVANIFIVANVRRIKRRVSRTRRRKRASRNARLSIVLLVDLITFLIVSLPVLLVECIYRFTRTVERSTEFDMYLDVAWSIANKIFYLNYSLSFYFYVLTSSYFRHHFLLAIRCKQLHSILFRRPFNRHNYQNGELVSKYRTSRLSSTPKITTRNCDFNIYSPQQSE